MGVRQFLNLKLLLIFDWYQEAPHYYFSSSIVTYLFFSAGISGISNSIVTNLFFSAGISGISSSISSDFLGDKSPEEEKKDKEVGKEGEKQDAKGEDFFSSAFSKVKNFLDFKKNIGIVTSP